MTITLIIPCVIIKVKRLASNFYNRLSTNFGVRRATFFKQKNTTIMDSFLTFVVISYIIFDGLRWTKKQNHGKARS